MRRVGCVLVMWIGCAGAGWAQLDGRVLGTPRSHPDASLTLGICDEANRCGDWTFTGTNGHGEWPNGAQAVLQVMGMRDNQITITRQDTAGPFVRMRVTYTGELRGDEVRGTYQGTLNGQTFTGEWHWVPTGSVGGAGEAPPMPAVIHFCDSNCMTLQQVGEGHYQVQPQGPMPADWSDTWTVQRWTRGDVTMQRNLTYNGNSSEVEYHGTLSPAGDRLLGARSPYGNVHEFIRMAWGPSLNTVPGTNAQRDSGQFDQAWDEQDGSGSHDASGAWEYFARQFR
jgi:hypothetical protein